MEIVPLEVWYPGMAAKWDDRISRPWSDREAWVHHHTAGGTGSNPLTYARTVADFHWSKWRVPGGYNFLVGTDGVIREMCGFAYQGVHAGSTEWNRKGVAVCFQGDFRVRTPSQVMLDAAAELIASKPLPQTTHRAVRPTPTTCPGSALAQLIPLEVDDMPLTQADADLVVNTLMKRRIWTTPEYLDQPNTPFEVMVSRDHRNVNELIQAHRKKLLGVKADVDLGPEDIAEIVDAIAGLGVARQVADLLADRLAD